MTQAPERPADLPTERRRPHLGIGFRQPLDDLPPDPIPSPGPSPETTTTTPRPDLLDGPGSDPDWLNDDESPDEQPPSSSEASGTRKAANPLVGKALRDTFRNGIIIASDQAHRFLASSPGQREVQLYLADDDDAANVGDPLSRIAGRRQTLGEMSEDSADVMAAMMGLAGYATKQIQKRAIASKIDERRATSDNPQPLPGDDGMAL